MHENGQLTVLNIDSIMPNRFQPRLKFDEEKLEELASSISKYGVIQPVVVRPVNGKFEIIAGERRFKASKLVGRSTIPAIVINLSDKDSEEIALLENVQRQALSPIEEAVSYKRILDMGYITQEQLAQKLGKSQSAIANKIRLLNLDDEVQSYLLNNKISERHARSLLRLSNPEVQVDMLHRIVDERLTVKQTDKEIEKVRNQKTITPVNVEIKKETQTSELNDEIESLFSEKEERSENMDIDRIMREAKDINAPVKEEVKDITGLMQQKNDVQSEPIVRQEPEVNIEAGKFISGVSEKEEVKKDIPVNSSVTFDSVFNQGLSVPQNNISVESAGTVNNAPTQNVSVPVTPNIPATPNVKASETIEDEVSIESKKAISSAVASALKKYNFNKANKSVNVPDSVNANNQAVSSLENNNGVSNSAVSMPVNTSNVEAPNVSTSPVNISSAVVPDVSTPVSSVNNESVSTPNISMSSINPSNVNPQNISTPVTPQVTSIPDTNIIGDNIAGEVKNVQTNNFADIVRLLRECASQIESKGYFVATDELDLGNQYKVTFTINKE